MRIHLVRGLEKILLVRIYSTSVNVKTFVFRKNSFSAKFALVFALKCEIQLMQLSPSPKNGIMQGPGVHWMLKMFKN